MKIAKNLISLFVFILAVVCFGGCSHLDKTDVKTVISNELNLLKNLDSDTAQKYVSYKELFPDATTETSLSQEVEEVFSLFFQDFDYQILDLDVDEDKKEATAPKLPSKQQSSRQPVLIQQTPKKLQLPWRTVI